MPTLIRKFLSNKPLALSLVGILVVGASVPTAAVLLAPAEQAKAQQGGPPGGGGLVVRTVPVGVGPISSVLGYAGAIQPTQQVNIVARIAGSIESLPVDVGTLVRQGDVLATLDPGALPAQLLQAKATLLSAQAKLSQVEAGAKPEDVAAADAQVQQAQLKLTALQQGRPEDVRGTQAALDAANARLTLLLRGATDDTRQAAQSAVDADAAALTAAEAAVANFTGTSASDLQAAQSAVDGDRAALTAAQAALDNLRGTNASDLQAAQSAVDTDSAQIAAAQVALQSLSGTTVADVQSFQSNVTTDLAVVAAAQAAIDQANAPTDAQTQAAQQLVAAAQAALDSSKSTKAALDHPTRPSGPTGSSAGGGSCAVDAGGSTVNSTQCSAARTAAESSIAAAQQQLSSAQAQLSQLQHGGPPATKLQLQSNLITAQEKLKVDKAKLAAENGTISSQQATAQTALTTASEKLKADQARLDSLRNGTFASQQATAQSTLVSAQQKLKTDQARLDAIVNGTQEAQRTQLDSALEAARQKLTSDQAKLDVLNAGPTAEDIRQAQDAVVQAQQNVLKAQRPGAEPDMAAQQAVINQMLAQLQSKQNTYTDADLQAAVAGVAQAEAAVALAQANVDQTTVIAPFAGLVTTRQLSAGSYTTPATPIVTLSSGSVEIHVTVEEARLGQVRAGLDVSLTVPAYPGVTFPAKVTTIAPTADARAHTFDVKIVPAMPDGRLMPGMFAQVQVVAAQKPEAILVPREAVIQQGTQPVVFVNDNGKASQRPVRVGLSDNTSIEILSGLATGEQVVVVGQNGLREGAAIQIVDNAPSQRSGAPQQGAQAKP